MPRGSEMLIVDGAERDREGMRMFFDTRGYVVTAVADGATARRLATQKFFPVALIDLDVDQAGAGIDLARFVRERSPQTAVVMLTMNGSFEGAVEAFRLGAIDVVRKSTDQVE